MSIDVDDLAAGLGVSSARLRRELILMSLETIASEGSRLVHREHFGKDQTWPLPQPEWRHIVEAAEAVLEGRLPLKTTSLMGKPTPD